MKRIAAILILLCMTACGGGGGKGQSDTPTNSNTPGVDPGGSESSGSGTSTSPSSDIYAGGSISQVSGQNAILKIANAMLNVPAATLTSEGQVSLAETQDEKTDDLFSSAMWQLPHGTQQGGTEFRIRVSGTSVVDGKAMSVKVNVPDELAQTATTSNPPLAYQLTTYVNEDEEHDEDIEGASQLVGSFDPATNEITVEVPTSQFVEQADGTQEFIFRLMPPQPVTAKAATDIRIKAFGKATGTRKALSTPTTLEDDSRFGYVNPLSGPGNLNPLLITGPYSEPGHGGGTSRHAGIDFSAHSQKVYAADDGYIYSIMRKPPGPGNRSKTCQMIDNPYESVKARTTQKTKRQIPNQNCLFFVTIAHPDGTFTRYLHLQADSVVDQAGNPFIAAGISKSAAGAVTQSQIYFKETNPASPQLRVTRGQWIATSGISGTNAYHLHFEASRGYATCSDALSCTFNPILMFSEPLFTFGKDGPKKAIDVTLPTQTLPRVGLYDNFGQEVLVRRDRGNLYLPATAQANDFPVDRITQTCKVIKNPAGKDITKCHNIPGHSNWPLVEMKWVFDDTDIGRNINKVLKRYPDYTQLEPGIGSPIANGGVKPTISIHTDRGYSKFDPEVALQPNSTTVARLILNAVHNASEGNIADAAPAITTIEPGGVFARGAQINITTPAMHWAATYSISECSQLPADVSDNVITRWGIEYPCAMGTIIRGAVMGYFHFSDDSNEVIFGADDRGYGEQFRKVFNLGWRSTFSEFKHTIPWRKIGVIQRWSGINSLEEMTGTRVILFTVNKRSATNISGTFHVDSTSGYINKNDIFTAIPTWATGTWSANLVYEPKPNTKMNGYDYCFRDNVGHPYLTGVFYDNLSWGNGFIPNSCQYE